MMNYKRKYLIFIILIAFVSIGGVSANTTDNTTSITNVDVLDETVLIDESLYVDNQTIIESDLATNFNNSEKFDDSINVIIASNLEVSDKLLFENDSLLGGYVVNSPIVNPDFEDGLNGWDNYGASITNFAVNSKSGTRFVSLSTNTYISQCFNFDTIDSVSFWYMSNTKGSTIDIFVDDVFLGNYTIQKTGLSKKRWEEVKVDLSNFTGYHTLNISQFSGLGYLDYVTIDYNNVLANFTIESYEVLDGKITINFTDLSYGLISEYRWDFGDGNYSNNQNPTHIFKLNNYTITLTVTDGNNTDNFTFDLIVSLSTIECSGEGFSTIQEAIDNALDGDVIIINSCDYYDSYSENLIIDKSLTLDFNNCTLVGDSVNPTINIIGNNTVIFNNLSFNDVSLKLENSSNLILQNLNEGNVTLDKGNFEFINSKLEGVYLTVNDANVTIINSEITSGGVIVNGGKTRIINSSFTHCDVAITQTDGELELTSNIIHNNAIGVNVTSGISNLSFNTLYYNNISLVYNSSNINYKNNWWGKNKPVYNYSTELINCDVLQLGGVKSQMDAWIVLNITQSDYLDYDYWIAGITYYNLTLDLTHNNLGEDTNSQGCLRDFIITLSNYEEYNYLVMTQVYTEYPLIEHTLITEVSEEYVIRNGLDNCIFSLGYLTSDFTELNLTILGKNYTVALLNNSNFPVINYITPSTIFDDNITVEIDCTDDAVVFYTLDGTNPSYSATRLIYKQPFIINESSTVRYAVVDKWGNFQKVFNDRIDVHGYITFNRIVKQDVFVELETPLSYGNLYYNLNGSTFEKVDAMTRSNFSDCIHYTHPFIVHELTTINVCCEDFEEHDINGPYYVSCYSFDFSVNYIKNSTFNSSGAVWSQYQGDINNTGVTNYTGPLTNQSSWINNNVISSGSVVVDNKGHVYVGSSDGYLYCLNTQGLVIWRFGTTSRIICTPTIGADGNIYFSNWMNSTVYCISPEGKLIWKYNLGDYNTGTSPVFGLNNRLYIITSNSLNSNLYIFKEGVLLSNHTIPFISGSTPVISDDGTLYLISANHELIILNFDGSIRKATFIDTSALIKTNDQNTQISISLGSDEILYVLNYMRSTRYGSFPTIHPITNKSVNGDIFYHCVVNAYYLNGTCKWSITKNVTWSFSEFKEYVSGTPTYYKDTVYIAGNDNLIAVNASNGELLWMKPISHSGSTASSPLVSGDEVLYVTSNNMVYAFNLSGELIWQYEITGIYGNPISYASPTLTADGTLIVTTNQGIYAFRDIAADFTYQHVNGTETTIQFTDLSTNGTNRYFWLFGDNTTSFEQNPVHTYNQSGKYRVTLFVEYNGNITLARNTTIEVVFHDITPPSNVTCYINNTLTTGGVFNQTQFITLNASDDASSITIYYTVDGSNPMDSPTRRTYNTQIEIEVNTVLNMVAKDAAGNYGNIATVSFNITDVIDVHEEVNSTLIDDIQSLLHNAEPGSKILFDYGVLENATFTINKPLNIISNNNTILIGNGKPSFIFNENASGSILNGFTINNTGILIKDASDVLIQNCLVNVSEGIGINIINSTNTTLKSTSVTAEEGIVVNNSYSTLLDSVHVSDCYSDGIWIYQSNNTNVINSLVEYNGKDPYKLNYGNNSFETTTNSLKFITTIPASQSRANNILIDDSNNTYVYNNVINRGFFGIHLYHHTDGVVLDNNTIYEGSGDAILLSNNYSNVNITHNLIDGCYNGIDFMGYSQNVLIKQNTIENLHEHDNDLYIFGEHSVIEQVAGYIYETFFPVDEFFRHHYNGIQVSYPASNFHEGNVTIIDNVVIRLDHRAWEARKYQHYLEAGCDSYGYNLMDGSASYTGAGGATHYTEGKVDLVVDRIGDATFRLRLINRLDGHYLSEIPSFDVTFTTGAFTQTVQFVNDSAIATFDVAMALTDVEAIISTEIRKSAHFDMPITEGYNSTNREYDPGFEEGEAINNPDPVIPSFDEVIKRYTNPVTPNEPEEPKGSGNGTGDGNGQGTGSGTGTGSGNGSSGTFGNGKNNIFGKVGEASGILSNITGIGDISTSESPSSDDTNGMDRSSEGGSDAGNSETVNAYEVSKVIDIEKSNLNFVAAVILFAVIIVLGYGYRRTKKDGDEF